MIWNRTSRASLALIVLLAAVIAGVGIFMPDIRDALVFKPRRAAAEAAVRDVAVRESGLRKAKGKFDVFTPGEAPVHLRRMGMSLADWPSDDFILDASLVPNGHLRIRALPRPEAVQALQVDARIFVADLAPSGEISQSGWYP